MVMSWLQEALDGIEFARGDPQSKWGSVRAAMGHPEPFDLRYVAIGNEDCGKKNYRGFHLLLILFYFILLSCLIDKIDGFFRDYKLGTKWSFSIHTDVDHVANLVFV